MSNTEFSLRTALPRPRMVIVASSHQAPLVFADGACFISRLPSLTRSFEHSGVPRLAVMHPEPAAIYLWCCVLFSCHQLMYPLLLVKSPRWRKKKNGAASPSLLGLVTTPPFLWHKWRSGEINVQSPYTPTRLRQGGGGYHLPLGKCFPLLLLASLAKLAQLVPQMKT